MTPAEWEEIKEPKFFALLVKRHVILWISERDGLTFKIVADVELL